MSYLFMFLALAAMSVLVAVLEMPGWAAFLLILIYGCGVFAGISGVVERESK